MKAEDTTDNLYRSFDFLLSQQLKTYETPVTQRSTQGNISEDTVIIDRTYD